jgi:hypothetical protein
VINPQELASQGAPAVDRIARNAFRILGLPANAPVSAIHESEAAIRRSLKLGTAKTSAWDLPFAGVLPRTDGDLRDAVGRLTDPASRLEERMFWFSSGEEVVKALSATTLDRSGVTLSQQPAAAAHHDAALVKLLAAGLLDPELKEGNGARWTSALKEWKKVVEQDDWWSELIDIEMNGGFEPMATVEEMQALRANALRKVADVLAAIARDAVSKSQMALGERAMRAIQAAQLPEDVIHQAQADVVGPMVADFEKACQKMSGDLSDQIKREDGKGSYNLPIVQKAHVSFENDLQPRLTMLVTLASGAGSEVGLQAREAAALCLRSLAINYTWAEEFEKSRQLLERAKGLAIGSPVAARIETDLAGVQQSATREAQAVCNIDINGTQLVINRQELKFGTATMPTRSINALRFGIYKHYTNGVRDHQSYAIWVTDGSRTINIECAKGWRAKDAVIEQRWKVAIDAVFECILGRLMDEMIDGLKTGKGFVIGGIKFDKTGMTRVKGYGPITRAWWSMWHAIFKGKTVEQREQEYRHITWQEFHGHGSGNGRVNLWRTHPTKKGKTKLWISWGLRDTWNAVCISPLLSYLYKDGKLWTILKAPAS